MEPTKKIIYTCTWDLSKHKNRDANDTIKIKSYTALWCPPCRKIKKKLPQLLNSDKITHMSFIYSDDATRPKMVPFFEFIDNNNEIIDYIQTSNIKELNEKIKINIK